MRHHALSAFLLAVLLPIAGCASFPGVASDQVRWGTYDTNAAKAVLLYGDAGDEVRLLSPSGTVVSSAVLHAPDQTLCKAAYVLPLPSPDVAAFLGHVAWPAGYRLQTAITGRWTDVVPLAGGCNAVE